MSVRVSTRHTGRPEKHDRPVARTFFSAVVSTRTLPTAAVYVTRTRRGTVYNIIYERNIYIIIIIMCVRSLYTYDGGGRENEDRTKITQKKKMNKNSFRFSIRR